MNFILPLQVLFIFSSFFYPAKQEEPCCKINVPNTVTGNGDGISTFNIVVGCEYNAFSAMVFDRWGLKLLDYSSSGEKCLDSLNKRMSNIFLSRKLTAGTYFYIVKAMNPKDTCVVKGPITLIR